MIKEVLKAKKRVKRPHILYLVVLEHPITKESFTKIGITAYSLQMRFIDCDYKIKYSKEYSYPDGIQARGWESLLKEQIIPFNWKYYPKQKNFVGKTECYELPKVREIEAMMDELLIPKKRGRKKKEVVIEEALPRPFYYAHEIDYKNRITEEEIHLWGDIWYI